MDGRVNLIRKVSLIIFYIILVLIGYTYLLKSDTWNLGSIVSMNIVGIITSITGIIGFFIEVYRKDDSNKK